MDDHVIYLMNYPARLHAQHSHPNTPFKMAAVMGVQVIAANEDSANAGPPAVLTYNAAHRCKTRFPLWHELGHIVSMQLGIEAYLEEIFEPGEAARRCEDIADLVGGVSAVPTPLVKDIIQRYGVSAESIVRLAEKTRLSESTGLRRLVYHDLTASRAAAIVRGSHVYDLAAQNYELPLFNHARIPEAHPHLPKAELRSLRKGGVLAVWNG